MIDLEVDPVLDARLRRAFNAIAAVTPVGDVSWTANVRVERSSPTRLLAVAASVVLLAAGAVGVWKVSSRTGPTEPANTLPRPPLVVPPPMIVPPTPVTPEGTEYPIERVPAFELGLIESEGPVVDGVSIGYSQTADSSQYRYRTLDVQGDYVVERSCFGALLSDATNPSETVTGVGCGNTVESSVRPNIGSLWQQEDGQSGIGFWRWTNVPSGSDFVQYRSGDLIFWQHPLDGYVHFPVGSPAEPEAVAYRADGAILGTVNAATVAAANEEAAAYFSELNEGRQLDGEKNQEARDGVQDQFAGCLASHGITFRVSGGYQRIADPPTGEDIDPVWQVCLVDAQQWLDVFIDVHS